MDSGKPILEGADFTAEDLEAMEMQLVNAPTTLLQQNNHMPINWSAGLTGGTTIQLSDGELGIIATAGISNKWRTRDTLQQSSLNDRSEEHTSELQSLMRISYAVFCLKKKNNKSHYLKLFQLCSLSILIRFSN